MSNKSFRAHAVQLRSLQVLKLSIEVHDVKTAHSADYQAGNYAMEAGHSDFDTATSTIHVSMRVRAGRFAVDEDNSEADNEEYEKQPVSIWVEVGGVFIVDTEEFPVEQIPHWAEFNAPLIIYPYVREQVYGLSTRVGIKPLLLPLLEIPSFRIVKK
ncbi:protein-export chaperone SecB [Serratia bockelmannii]|uniref:protein-export chaperone SecB n=1 Tax=Serratia TaxID=613 RepID=UPI0013DA0F66|nr:MULTISPECIES: protein-export chaperone SecB [Serratia]MCW7648766.1 protein-export chaperone SecB [Serratia bockelmannii]MCW7658759.1 protein-export chaperone SecB [Serratia bockelmannii]MCW7678335.1 protein-export chaperone SecB [Serratia bockelmannii]MCW7683112.1 protein-export chaperone SecB [Serratia bockelmannii]MCW7688097.1 protein-export chaperone SecB [Serratia bockelmannii]